VTTTPTVWRNQFVDNATDNGFQQDSGVVAATSDGNFYAIWRDSGNFNSGHSDIVGRSFDTFGTPVGGDVSLLPLNNAFGVPFNASQPATVALPIAGQADGTATAFTDNFNNGPDFDVYVVRTNASLTRLENPLLIDGSTSVANDPSVTSFADGGLVVSYTIQNSTTDWDILARTVSPSGVVGPVITIFNDTDRSDLSDLATLKNGNFVAVFESQFLGSPTDLDVFFTIKTENGTNVVSPTTVTGAGSTATETNPHVAALAGGGFVVTWTDSAGDVNGTSQGIRASVYDASGNLVNNGGDILVNQFNQAGTQQSNDVTALPDGGFVVAWEDIAAGVDRVQRFDGTGNLVGTPVTISNLSTFDVNAATLTDGRSVYTINDFSSGNNNTASSILDTRTTDPMPNPPPPAGTTADMVLRGSNSSTVIYEIYDIGNNAILAGYTFGQVGTTFGFVTLSGFNGSDTTDMLLRDSGNGGFEVYDISNNNITNAASLGAVGLDWQPMGFGNFSSLGENDMILRNVNNGGVEVYDIRNNQITGANSMGAVGLNWQFSGVGNFSGRGTSDMILRDSNNGGLEVYDINNNAITNAAFIGTVGLDWQFSGVGNFSGVPGETDLLLRNVNNGGLEVYNINNNQLTGAAFIGTVGLDWQFAGVAPVNAAGASDLVLRNVNTGTFEAYDIANNQITGAAPLGSVGLEFQLGGFAADPPTGATGNLDGSTSQLVQAMASFGGDSAAAPLSTAPLGADTSQQPLLTTPQHA
jgi:hypothetical protein